MGDINKSNPLGSFYAALGSGKPEFTVANRSFFWVEFTFPTERGKQPRFSNYDINLIPMLVRDIDLPNFKIQGADTAGASIEIRNILGAFKTIGNANMLAEDNDVTITFLDTEKSIIEYFFVPWIREVIRFNTKGQKTSFPRANIYVYGLRGTNPMPDNWTFQYKIEGAYPSFVDTPTFDHTNGHSKITRTVNFEFNNLTLEVNGAQSADNYQNLYKAIVSTAINVLTPGLSPNYNPAEFLNLK